MDCVKLLRKAEEAGLKVTQEGDVLKIRGPKSASAIAEKLLANKDAVLEALSPKDACQELIERLQSGIDWFIGVDKDLWKDDYPINTGTALERKMTASIHKWGELERLLRNLYEYEGCIFEGGSCPEESPVRCTGCK